MALDENRKTELRQKLEAYARTRDPRLRDEVIEAHLGLAEHLARRFANRGESLDDLVQVASMALVKAVERFDPGRGLEFSTFATPTIVGELKRHFRDRGWSVRVPRRVQELHLRVNSVITELSQDLGRSPTIQEVASYLDVDDEDVLEAMEAGQAYRASSIDASSGSGDEEESLSLVAQLGGEDTQLGEAESRVLLGELIQVLPKREQLMLHLRFFEGMTQSAIAERLGISQMHVSRLLARSLRQLREAAEAGTGPR